MPVSTGCNKNSGARSLNSLDYNFSNSFNRRTASLCDADRRYKNSDLQNSNVKHIGLTGRVSLYLYLSVFALICLQNTVEGQKFQYSKGWMPGGKRASFLTGLNNGSPTSTEMVREMLQNKMEQSPRHGKEGYDETLPRWLKRLEKPAAPPSMEKWPMSSSNPTSTLIYPHFEDKTTNNDYDSKKKFRYAKFGYSNSFVALWRKVMLMLASASKPENA